MNKEAKKRLIRILLYLEAQEFEAYTASLTPLLGEEHSEECQWFANVYYNGGSNLITDILEAE